jgi:hypothetical protein
MSKQDIIPPFSLTPAPICTACFNFTTDGRRIERKTVVVVPNTIQTVNGKTVIGWACSRGRSCVDRDCHYSRPPREDEDVKPAGFFDYGDR